MHNTGPSLSYFSARHNKIKRERMCCTSLSSPSITAETHNRNEEALLFSSLLCRNTISPLLFAITMS